MKGKKKKSSRKGLIYLVKKLPKNAKRKVGPKGGVYVEANGKKLYI